MSSFSRLPLSHKPQSLNISVSPQLRFFFFFLIRFYPAKRDGEWDLPRRHHFPFTSHVPPHHHTSLLAPPAPCARRSPPTQTGERDDTKMDSAKHLLFTSRQLLFLGCS